MNKTIVIIIIIVLVIIGGIFIWQWANKANPVTNSANGTSTSTSTSSTTANSSSTAAGSKNLAKGTMYFSLSDASMNIPNVTTVAMTIDKVELYSQLTGWVMASQTPQTFNLLQLNAQRQAVLLAKVSAPAVTYTQFHFHIAKVTITQSGVVKPAILPSNDLIVNTQVIVNAKTNSAAQLDVMANQSLHETSSGQFVFTPVVQFDSRVNATVSVGANNVMSVSFGETNAAVNLGMDVNGEAKVDFMLPANAKLSVTNGVVSVVQ